MRRLKEYLKNDLGSQEKVYTILVVIFTVSILLGNTVVNKFFQVFGDFYLTPAVFLFPIPMIIGDIVSEVYSKNHMKKMIFIGFFMNIFMVLIYLITVSIQTDVVTDEAYRLVLGSTFRILVASLTAYLFSQFVNSSVMWALKAKAKEGKGFKRRAFLSTVIGQICDNFTFGFIAFIGILPLNVIIIMNLFEITVEILMETLILPLTHKIHKVIERLPE